MNRTQRKVVEGQMADFVRGRLDPKEALRVLEAVEQDSQLSDDLNIHIELQNLARSDDGAGILGSLEGVVESRPVPAMTESWWDRLHKGRRLLVPAVISLAMVLAGVATLIFLAKPSNPYVDLADLGDIAASFRMRGGSDAELLDASNRLMEGDAREAANRFERFLRMYPVSEWRPWVEYAAGLSRLSGARTAFFGIGVRYDPAEVKIGLDHLDRVLEGSSARELVEDALWYRVKGSLMLEDAAGAESGLNRILSMQGSRQAAARKLLSDLRSLH